VSCCHIGGDACNLCADRERFIVTTHCCWDLQVGCYYSPVAMLDLA